MNNVTAVRFKSLRKASGCTQQETAALLCISQPMLSQIEQGLKNPSLKTFINAADLYGCTVDWLLGRGDDEAFRITEDFKFKK